MTYGHMTCMLGHMTVVLLLGNERASAENA